MTPDLVVLGNLLVDDLVFEDGRTRMHEAGGAILHGALAATLWGARVGCVSLEGDDYPPAALAALAARGVLLDGLVPLHRDGVRTWLLYEGRTRRVIHRLGCPSHAEVSPRPEHVPPAWLSARAFHLAPMPLPEQQILAERLGAGGALVSVDPHVPVTAETLPEWRAVLAHADVFLPSDDEFALPGAERDPHSALRSLAGGRLRFVFWKRGARGGLLFDAHSDRFHEWGARADEVVDPTGAGDAFAMGFLTAHLAGADVESALLQARVSASFALAGWGAEGLLAATPGAAAARRTQWASAGALS